MDSWMPVTPEKPIPTRSNQIPVDWHGNQMGRANWQEVTVFSNGYAKEMPNYNGLRRNLNLTGQVVQNGGNYGYDAGLAQKNGMINHIAGTHSQTLGSDSTVWKNDSFAQLLLMQNATLMTTANRDLNGSLNMAENSPLMPNSHLHLHSHVDCSQRDSTISDGLLFNNQNHYAGFDPLSNLANRLLIPEMHSGVDSNQRDSNPASLFFSNQNHYPGSKSLDNSDNYTQIPNYGFPIPYEPHWDLNSTPAEIKADSSVTNTLLFTPIIPDQVKKLENNQHSARLNIIRNESSCEAKNNDTPLTSSENKSSPHQSDELLQSIVNSSPAANNALYKKNKDSEKGSIPGMDLKETPQQKPPRRRKHRPKVVREGKPKRTPKPKTPKNTKEAQTGKRKYVRKNIQKESAPELADASRETANAKGRTAAKSCRRSLNFDMEKLGDESQAVGHQELPHRNKGAFSLSSDSRATELCHGTYSVSGTKSVALIDQRNGLMEEQQQSGNIINLIHSTSQFQTDYVPLQHRQAAAASLAPEKDWSIEDPHVIGRNIDEKYSDPFQNSCRNGWNPISQQIHAEGIDKVVLQANSNHDSMEKEFSKNTTQSVPKFPSNSSTARGSKREHFRTIEGTNPNIQNPVISLLYQEIQTDECCKGKVFGRGFSETWKKKKTVSRLHTNCSGMPCGTEVEDGSGKAKTKQMANNSANGLTETTNHDLLKSYFRSPKIAERQSEANKFTSERCNQSMTVGQNLLMQEIMPDLQSHAEMTEETSSLAVHDYPSLAAIKNCYMLQPSPSKQVPELENQVLQTSHVPSTKQNIGPIPSRSVSARRNKVSKNDVPLCAYQKSPAKRRGRPPTKRIHAITLDEIIHRLKCLDLNEGSNELVGDEPNAVVPYKGYGALVPYPGFEVMKKSKPRPKVDLDPETNRIWNLLMNKEGSKDFEGTDKEKEKWWEEERKVFHGRTDSFIARMHLIQGDRRFSRWKGSVVDSVIGVFLTQNVSDHLSSSAFMSLAARFPLQSLSNNRTCDNSGTSTLSEESEVSINHQGDTIGWQEKVPSRPIFSFNSMTHLGSTERQTDSETTGRERSIMETQSQSMGEEVISSQDPFDSLTVQGPGGLRSSSGSNSEEEDFTIGCRPSEIHFPTLTNLLQMEKTSFQEFYIQNTHSLANKGSSQVQKQYENIVHPQKRTRLDRADDFNGPYTFTYPSSDYHLQMNLELRISEEENFKAFYEESISPLPTIDFRFTKATDKNSKGFRTEGWAGSEGGRTVQQNEPLCSQETLRMDPSIPLSNQSVHQESISRLGPHSVYDLSSCNNHLLESNKFLRLESSSVAEPAKLAEAVDKRQNNDTQQIQSVPKVTENAGERISAENKQMHLDRFIKPNSAYSSGHAYDGTSSKISKAKKGRTESEKTREVVDWDCLRKQVHASSRNIERSKDTQDSLDYEAIRLANVSEISQAIKERGMNNMLAERIKEFLNRLVREHGSIDLEWLRAVPPDKAKDYLLSIRGLGLKSVECVRLLTLHHLAFPVDTNVGRIAVRLGWVPLQPLPESLQLHLLELYPVLESIQKYLWPRLCNLDQRTLYELHYQLITFGKVFCTKSKPNCNACPMRGECRHFASAFASARLALPGLEEKSIVDSTVPILDERNPAIVINLLPLLPPESDSLKGTGYESRKCEPIIEEPATPEQECTEISESDIEDAFYDDPDEIPTIKLDIEEFAVNLQNYMQEKMELEECDMSKALVALKPEVASSIPTAKLKNVSRLRTEHQVYELPDSHPLLERMDRREPDDPSPYLLAIWTPGETAYSIQPPETSCGSHEPNKLCNGKTCFSCNSVREANAQTVRGTLLIPCRTAMRGSFPLNGTYFQVNEVFADHESSLNPIDVPRAWIWNLRRRTVYFGTSVTTIFKGLSTEGIQLCFWRGFVCVRGFDQKRRAPRPLMARLHFPASKLSSQKLRTSDKQDMMQKDH